MSAEPVSQLDALKAVYKVCVETRNFEIDQLIQRNNFFMLFQGVLLAAVLQTQASKPMVEVLVCLCGIAVSWYQTQMASGAKFWQEWWEGRVEHYERQLEAALGPSADRGFHDLFAVPMDRVDAAVRARLRRSRAFPFSDLLILARFPVGRAPIRVGVVLLATWTALTAHALTTVNFPLRPVQVQGFGYAPTPSVPVPVLVPVAPASPASH